MLHIKTPYLYKRGNVFYYSRRIPVDLQDQYITKKIVVSLRTSSMRSAVMSSSHLSVDLNSYWSSIRIRRIAKSYVHQSSVTPSSSTPFIANDISIEEAKELYLKLKGHNKPKLFHQVAHRNINYLITSLGNRDLSSYSSVDAGKFRDDLLQRDLASSSVRRVFSCVKAIVSLAIKEQGLNIINPFLGVYIPDLNDTKDRKPVPIECIRGIQHSCQSIDDELRWIIALISDTGMRLAEAIGLKAEDVVLDTHTPHILIRPNKKRRLKTKYSERAVPLVGLSLWAIKRAVENQPTSYLFKRYNKTAISNANSASAALNKWMKGHVDKGIVIHSFRHSMRDRLRAVECPADIVDSIGGWSKGSIGENYGSGYPLEVLHKWMKKIEQPIVH